MKILTVIIPSYNTSRFIDKNLPTFLDDRLVSTTEILIINDGSTDDTSEKAHKYEEKYPDLIRVIDKENGGHGSVINIGSRVAKGKYCKVVDGDDWVETDGLIKLAGFLANTDTDVVLNPYYTVDASHHLKRRKQKIGVNPGNYCFNEISDRTNQFRIHTITIKTNILKKIHITENCYYDDVEYALFPVRYIENVSVLKYPVYTYLIGQKTQSVSDTSVLKYHFMEQRILFDSIGFYESVKVSLDNAKRKFFIRNICILGRQTYNIYLRNYKVEGAYEKYLMFDDNLRRLSPYFYNAIGRSNRYIVRLRKNGRPAFNDNGRLLHIYKLLT